MRPMTAELKEAFEENRRLEQENAVLREALEWYADDGNYTHDLKGNHISTAFENHKIQSIAREALDKARVLREGK